MEKHAAKIIGGMLLLMLLGIVLVWEQDRQVAQSQVRLTPTPDPSRITPPPEIIANWISKFRWEETDIPNPPYTWEPFGSQYKTFYSSTVSKTVSYLLWLPPGYATSTKRYPVVYWLPGGEGNQFQVGSFLQDLEGAINAGEAPPMIVVGVNGIVCCSFFVNSFAGDLPLETIIINDLIPHIDSTYRTIAQREFRAVEGFSMGGYGASHLGFNHPDLFGVISDHAGALFDIKEAKAALCCNNIYRGWNYPFGANEAYFTANYPFTLAEQNASAIRGKTHIRIMFGDQDSSWLIQKNTELHQLLQSLNITHEFKIVAGATHDKFAYYDLLGFSAFNPFYVNAFSGADTALLPSPTPTSAPASYGTPSYDTPSYGTPSYGTPSTSGGNTSDLNKDGKVNIFDLSILLTNWGKGGTGDLNSDGKVNVFDLSILLRNWSK